MTTPTRTELVTLPYSLEQVPAEAAGWTIKIDYEHQTYDGVTFGATVKDGKRVLGVISDEGRGGGTHFRPADKDGWATFEAALNVLEASGEEFLTEETLCNRLYENAALFRDLNRKRNAVFLTSEFAVTVVDAKGNITSPEVLILNGPDTPEARAWMKERYPNAKVWVRRQGWEQL